MAQPCKRSADFPASLQAWHSYIFQPLEGFGLPWGPTSSGFLPLATEPLKQAEAFPVPGRVRLRGGEASSPGCCVRPGLNLGQAWESSRYWVEVWGGLPSSSGQGWGRGRDRLNMYLWGQAQIRHQGQGQSMQPRTLRAGTQSSVAVPLRQPEIAPCGRQTHSSLLEDPV